MFCVLLAGLFVRVGKYRRNIIQIPKTMPEENEKSQLAHETVHYLAHDKKLMSCVLMTAKKNIELT
jgi:Zn-dependent peptidase ImmA (M78 family)